MKEMPIYTNERDFRIWFEKNLAAFGVKDIILSQEVCPDYVLRMEDNAVLRVEAELFDVNFKYHKHDPSKVDKIIACYAHNENISGVPVVAVHKLWIYEPVPPSPLPAEEASNEEIEMLAAIDFGGSKSIISLASGPYEGNNMMWYRISPELVSSWPRGRIEESIFNIITPKAKMFAKRFHHLLLAANLSDLACDILERLGRRGLIEYRPIEWIAAAYDGALLDHEAWIPTEVRTTRIAQEIYREQIATKVHEWLSGKKE